MIMICIYGYEGDDDAKDLDMKDRNSPWIYMSSNCSHSTLVAGDSSRGTYQRAMMAVTLLPVEAQIYIYKSGLSECSVPPPVNPQMQA